MSYGREEREVYEAVHRAMARHGSVREQVVTMAVLILLAALVAFVAGVKYSREAMGVVGL